MNKSDGYSSFQEYFEDNQTERSGVVTSSVRPDYEGCVLVKMDSDCEVLPCLKEALDLSNMASNPLCGGYSNIILSETNLNATISSADEWLFD